MKGYKYITPILLSEVRKGDIVKTKPELLPYKEYDVTVDGEDQKWRFFPGMNGGTVEFVNTTVYNEYFIPIYFIEGVYRKITKPSEEYCPTCDTFTEVPVVPNVKGQTWTCPNCGAKSMACNTCPDHVGCSACCEKAGLV